MYKHHKKSVENVTEYFSKDDEILAVILGGSIAHGFAKRESDIDLMLVISEEDYRKRYDSGKLTYYNPDLCDYEGGYVDGKYITIEFMEKVLREGSEPARYAFENAEVTYTEIEELQGLVNKIAEYPRENKKENIKRFYAQFEAWKWYCDEALRKENDYLLNTAISKFLLFGGRLILVENETLYPYHKWFVKVLERVDNKPTDFMESFNSVLYKREKEAVEKFYKCVKTYKDWYNGDIAWPAQFMLDSEINWMTGSVPVDDI